MVIGEDEYKTELTLPAFARQDLEPRGFQVRFVHADPADKNNFPGLAQAVAGSDLVLISVRRRTPPNEQLDAIRAHLAAGKPLVGIRTASHAFAVRDPKVRRSQAARPRGRNSIQKSWAGTTPGITVPVPRSQRRLLPGAERHPILRGVDLTQLVSNGSLYKVTPLAGSTTPLVLGSIPGQGPEPVAWTNSPHAGQTARVLHFARTSRRFPEPCVPKAAAQRHLLGAGHRSSWLRAGRDHCQVNRCQRRPSVRLWSGPAYPHTR